MLKIVLLKKLIIVLYKFNTFNINILSEEWKISMKVCLAF